MLRAAGRVHIVNAGASERVLKRLAHLLDQRFALAALLRDLLRQGTILLLLEVLERQILELPTHLRHTKAVGERSIEIARLLRDAPALFLGEEIQRPHVVQAVGELDDDDARIFRDRQEELAIALDLTFLCRAPGGALGDLWPAGHNAGDLAAKLPVDVGDRDLGVFDDVMQQATGNGRGIELEIGQNLRDFDGVGNERLAGIALLTTMRLLTELIRTHEQFAIELVVQRMLILAPAWNELAFLSNRCRCRHSRPASAKLVYRPRPTIT